MSWHISNLDNCPEDEFGNLSSPLNSPRFFVVVHRTVDFETMATSLTASTASVMGRLEVRRGSSKTDCVKLDLSRQVENRGTDKCDTLNDISKVNDLESQRMFD
jgi:hypothetical protein